MTDAPVSPLAPRGVDDLLDDARTRIRRYTPAQAYDAQQRGAVVIDIRPAAQRAATGEIPGSVVIERNVLEWRLDPRSDARLDDIAHYDTTAVVVCQEGYASSLAADSLRALGIHAAGDLAGGIVAWLDAGLPVRPVTLSEAAPPA